MEAAETETSQISWGRAGGRGLGPYLARLKGGEGVVAATAMGGGA